MCHKHPNDVARQVETPGKGQFPTTRRIGLWRDLRLFKSKDIWLTRLPMIDFLYQRNYSVQKLFSNNSFWKSRQYHPVSFHLQRFCMMRPNVKLLFNRVQLAWCSLCYFKTTIYLKAFLFSEFLLNSLLHKIVVTSYDPVATLVEIGLKATTFVVRIKLSCRIGGYVIPRLENK